METLGPTEIEALIAASHDDPAALLGPHADPSGSLRILTFQPRASAVRVLPSAGSAAAQPMRRIHPDGLFELILASAPAAPFPYRLELSGADGSRLVADDPYRFAPLLGELDLFLLGEGTQTRAFNWLGAHPRAVEGTAGVQFAVWAPNAAGVAVVGDFNEWDGRRHPMRRRNEGGIWELFIPGLALGARYKYHIRSRLDGYVVDKADPYAFAAELRPDSASIVTDLTDFAWADAEWLAARAASRPLESPMAVYELHLGSWRRAADGGFLNYREIAHQLVAYVREMGYTHVELLPITEHPFDVSWGYQTTGYYAPTSRFGTPGDFMYFVDYCHRHGIGVFLDWVPSHFAKEEQGLGFFDGTHLYEYADPRKGEHLDWGTFVFDYGRGEVLTFLLSNAAFWLEVYHIDGMRVDAVASMLYLDHQRPAGQWVPNQFGGREHLEAVAFLRRYNELVHAEFPGVVTMAEESTTWPMVSRPTYVGGLGFTMKWNMGWMHDTLEYVKADPLYRRYLHNTMTFSIAYQYTENYLLPLSHDEVVHGKSPLVYKAPGDEWQKFATLRLLLGYMWGHPGKKLLFMGADFGQTSEWDYDAALPWDLLRHERHRGVQRWLRALNALYRAHPALWRLDYDPAGFRWIDCSDVDNSVLVLMRLGEPAPAPASLPMVAGDAPPSAPADAADAPLPEADPEACEAEELRPEAARQAALREAIRPFLIVACNFTPRVRHGYRIGVPLPGVYRERLCSDDRRYGGSGVINEGDLAAQAVRQHGQEQSILFSLPPLGVSVFELAGDDR